VGLVVLTVLAVLGAVASCGVPPGRGRTTLTVLTPWYSGAEKAAFAAVIASFEHSHPDIDVSVEASRGAAQALQADVQQGDAPDLAVMPNPASAALYARQGDLVRLDHFRDRALGAALLRQLRADYGTQWYGLLRDGAPAPYAVLVKAAVKSPVWYDPRTLSGTAPHTWAQLTALDRKITAAGITPWCLGLADPPNSGFPGTDWIEDILLHQSGARVYGRWVSGKLGWTSAAVRAAWLTWRQLVVSGLESHDRTLTAALTTFDAADEPMFTTPPGCELSHGAVLSLPSGVRPQPGVNLDFFTLPSIPPSAGGLRTAAARGTADAYEVSGDLMGLFRDSRAAERLLAYLAGPRAQRIFPTRQPEQAFSPDRTVSRALRSRYRADPVAGRLDGIVASKRATLCFDASDLMPAAMEDAFNRAVVGFVERPGDLDAILRRLDRVRTAAYRDAPAATACAGPAT
jgi:alpha-glucoside transport system substrate-binding protein